MMVENQVSYQVEEGVDPQGVADVFRRTGISRPVDDIERIAHMVHHANLFICTREDGYVVGLVRTLTDFRDCCFLSDLAVDQKYQRRGIGKTLLRTLKEHLGGVVMMCLLSAPEAMS